MRFSILIMFICLIFNSCFNPSPECVATKQAFQQQYDPASEAYQNEVINILQDKKPTDFGYAFETFIEGDPVYMMTSFRNEEYCFSVKVLVDNWDKLAGMRRTNGYSYPKALVNLQWTIKNINNKAVVVYEDMRRIID